MIRKQSQRLHVGSYIYLPRRGIYKHVQIPPKKKENQSSHIVANLTIKRVSDCDIIKVIFDQTNKTITDRYLRTIRQQIKHESYHWYKTMREGDYEYIHEFPGTGKRNNVIAKETSSDRIDNNDHNQHIQQTSLASYFNNLSCSLIF